MAPSPGMVEAVRFLRRPPLNPAVMLSYRLMTRAAVATLPEQLREVLRRPRPPGCDPRWPCVHAIAPVGRSATPRDGGWRSCAWARPSRRTGSSRRRPSRRSRARRTLDQLGVEVQRASTPASRRCVGDAVKIGCREQCPAPVEGERRHDHPPVANWDQLGHRGPPAAPTTGWVRVWWDPRPIRLARLSADGYEGHPPRLVSSRRCGPCRFPRSSLSSSSIPSHETRCSPVRSPSSPRPWTHRSGLHAAVHPGGHPREPTIRDPRPPDLDQCVGADPPRRCRRRLESSPSGHPRRPRRRVARQRRHLARARRADLPHVATRRACRAASSSRCRIALVATSYRGAVRATAIGIAYGVYGAAGAAAPIPLQLAPSQQWPGYRGRHRRVCRRDPARVDPQRWSLHRPSLAERPLVVGVGRLGVWDHHLHNRAHVDR